MPEDGSELGSVWRKLDCKQIRETCYVTGQVFVVTIEETQALPQTFLGFVCLCFRPFFYPYRGVRMWAFNSEYKSNMEHLGINALFNKANCIAYLYWELVYLIYSRKLILSALI